MLFAHQVSGQRVLCSVRGAPRLAACPSRTFKPARHGDAAVTCAGKGFGAPKTDSETAKQEKCYCGSGKLRAVSVWFGSSLLR